MNFVIVITKIYSKKSPRTIESLRKSIYQNIKGVSLWESFKSQRSGNASIGKNKETKNAKVECLICGEVRKKRALNRHQQSLKCQSHKNNINVVENGLQYDIDGSDIQKLTY